MKLSPVRPSLPLLLYSYLAGEMLAPFFASLLILYSVFFLVRLIPLLEVVLSLRIGLTDFIRICSYILPHMLVYVIPMAAMIGVVIGFTRLTNDKEILALKACGIGLRSLIPPVVLIAAALSLLTGLFSVKLLPAGELAMQQLMFQLAREKIEKGLKEKTFTEALGDLVVYVDEIDKENNWHGVYVSDMRNRKQPLITMAKDGYMDADAQRMIVTIVLNEGTMHNAQEADNQVVIFKRYQLQIPLKPPSVVGGDDVTMVSRGAMTQDQLLEAAAEGGHKGGTRPEIFLTEYYERLTKPVGCFLLCLLGMPLGMLASPGRRAIGIPIALLFFVLYHFATTFFKILAEDRDMAILPAMWLPNALFFLVTLYILVCTDRERHLLPRAVQDFLGRLGDFLGNWIRNRVQFFVELLRGRLRLPAKKRASILHHTMLVRADARTRIYHLPSCSHYHDTSNTIEFKDADVASQAGFEPCSSCRDQD